MRRLLPLLAAIAFLTPPAVADVVHVRNGGRVEGRVSDLGDAVEVETRAGKTTVSKADIDRIEPKPWPPPEAKETRREPAADAKPAARPPLLGDPYTQPFVGFTFRPPLDWKPGAPAEGARASFFGPIEKFFVPRLDVIQARLRDGATLDDFLEKWTEGHRKSSLGWTLVEESPTSVQGVLATRIVSTLGGPEAPFKNLAVAIRKGERAFLLSFTTGRGYYDRFLPVVLRSISTFRLLPEANLDEAQRKAFQAYYDAAFAHQKGGRPSEALAAFRSAAEILPGYTELHRAIAGLCAEMSRPEEATAAYRKVIALDPENADAHYNLGTLLYRDEKKDEAVKLFRKAIQFDADHGPAHVNLGVALAAKGAWAEARKVLERGCALVPESAAGHLALGRVYEKLNEPRRAEREFRDTLELEPGNAEAKAGVERLSGT